MPLLGFESRIKRNPLVVTQSDLTSFMSDRLTWALGSYLGLRPRNTPVLGPLVLGTRVHAALERFYGFSHDLVESYNDIAQEELGSLQSSGVVFDQAAWQKEAELGRIMLEGYDIWLQDTGADANFKVVGVEQKLSHIIDVDGYPVELRGKIDLRVKNTFTNQHLVVDFKTTNSFEKLVSTAHLSSQLKIYMLLERLVHKTDPEHYLQGALFIMFRKVRRGPTSKPPYYDRFEVHHSPARLKSYYFQVFGILRQYVHAVQALDAGVDWRLVVPHTPHPWTQYNDFKHVIDMMDDANDKNVQDMISDLFVQQDPHARYLETPADLLSEIA